MMFFRTLTILPSFEISYPPEYMSSPFGDGYRQDDISLVFDLPMVHDHPPCPCSDANRRLLDGELLGLCRLFFREGQP
jgi:hypothetical protein